MKNPPKNKRMKQLKIETFTIQRETQEETEGGEETHQEETDQQADDVKPDQHGTKMMGDNTHPMNWTSHHTLKLLTGRKYSVNRERS